MKYILFGDLEKSSQTHLSKFKDDSGYDLLSCVSSINEIRSFSVIDEMLNTSEDFDLIIINLDTSLVNSQNKNGIDILKYIRFKCEKDKKIITVSIKELTDWISEEATNSILIAPNNFYLQLPLVRKKLDYALFGTDHLEYNDLKEAYFPFVYPDFNFSDFNHSFANSYGFYIMEKFFKEFFDNSYDLKQNDDNKILDFAKADFLFKHSNINENQKERLKEAYNLINQETNKCIVHIDDEGDQQWYKLFKEVFDKHKYVSVNNIVNTDDNEISLNTSSIIEQLININALDLILIDLRLLGQHEDKKPIERLSGSNLIKAIRKEVDSAVPIILVSATDRLKSISLLQEYPYNVNYFWQKPRVDKGKINLTIIFNDLFEKINKALNLYRLPINKTMARTEYDLRQLDDSFNNMTLNDPLGEYDYFIFDANFFCDTTESYSKYLLSYYKLFKQLNLSKTSKKIIIIRDVVSEIFLNSIKDGKRREELRFVSSLSLEILKEHLSTTTISNLNYQVERSADNALIKGIKENKFKNKWEVIYTTFKVEDTFEDKANANKFLELSKYETILHADTTFKYLIRYLMRDKNILFISDDKGCRYGIAKELRFGKKYDKNKYSLRFFTNPEGHEYINYKIPKGDILINKYGHKLAMVNNDRFCEMINGKKT